MPTWYLARETTRHVKVVLGGDGGDELFGGYKRYAKHLRTRWRRGLVLSGLKAPAAIGGRGWQRLAEELRLDWRAAYALRFSGLTPGERAFLAPEYEPPPHYWRMPVEDGKADLSTLLEIDRLNYLPAYILRKADLCTMAHGLEMRAPFLDHRFVAAVLALPEGERFTTPSRQIFAPVLSPLADREPFTRKKRGFNPPIAGVARRGPRAAARRTGFATRGADIGPARRRARRRVRRRVARRRRRTGRADPAARHPRRIAVAARDAGRGGMN